MNKEALMEASYLLGWGKLAKIGGVTGLGTGLWLDIAGVAWTGGVVLAAAIALSGVGKAVHYTGLQLAQRERVFLVGSWTAFAVTLAAFLWQYLGVRFGTVESASWTLVIAAGGFAMIHYGLQYEYLDDTDEPVLADAESG